MLTPPAGVLRVTGSVTDAETKLPIDKFQVIPGGNWAEDQQPLLQRSNARTAREGKYSFVFSEPHTQYVLRIEAEGYLPAASQLLDPNKGPQSFDVQLRKASRITGIVRLPTGQPAAGAHVVLTTSSSPAYIQNGRLRTDTGVNTSVIVKTGDDGRFSLPPESEPFWVLALHDAGTAEISEEQLKASSDITLQKWGAIEGRLMIGAKPGASRPIAAHMYRSSHPTAIEIHFDHEVTADRDGRFKFMRVPPGDLQVSRTISGPVGPGTTMSMPTHTTLAHVVPGQTAQVTIGGTGRPVIGRIELPTGAKISDNWTYDRCSIYTDLSQGNRAPTQINDYPFLVQKDGSFRIEDAAAGTYTLDIKLRATGSDRNLNRTEMRASLSHNFTLPPIPTGRSDAPLDLGKIYLTILETPKPNQPPPPAKSPGKK
jgi:hypothetical protein